MLPVTLRNLEPQLVARQTAMPGKLVRLENDPATIAQWLRRVQEASQSKGEMVAIPKEEQADPAAAKPKMASDDVEADGEEGGSGEDATTTFEITKPEGPKAFEVVGIPLKDTGFYVVELESRGPGSVPARPGPGPLRGNVRPGHQSRGSLRAGARVLGRVGDAPR